MFFCRLPRLLVMMAVLGFLAVVIVSDVRTGLHAFACVYVHDQSRMFVQAVRHSLAWSHGASKPTTLLLSGMILTTAHAAGRHWCADGN